MPKRFVKAFRRFSRLSVTKAQKQENLKSFSKPLLYKLIFLCFHHQPRNFPAHPKISKTREKHFESFIHSISIPRLKLSKALANSFKFLIDFALLKHFEFLMENIFHTSFHLLQKKPELTLSRERFEIFARPSALSF